MCRPWSMSLGMYKSSLTGIWLRILSATWASICNNLPYSGHKPNPYSMLKVFLPHISWRIDKPTANCCDISSLKCNACYLGFLTCRIDRNIVTALCAKLIACLFASYNFLSEDRSVFWSLWQHSKYIYSSFGMYLSVTFFNDPVNFHASHLLLKFSVKMQNHTELSILRQYPKSHLLLE